MNWSINEADSSNAVFPFSPWIERVLISIDESADNTEFIEEGKIQGLWRSSSDVKNKTEVMINEHIIKLLDTIDVNKAFYSYFNTATDSAYIFENIQNFICSYYNYKPRLIKSSINKISMELVDIISGCMKDNWDGYNSCKINRQAYREAAIFLYAYPEDLPEPNDIYPEPNGSIAIEWYLDKSNHFIMALEGDSFYHYVGVYNDVNRQFGRERISKNLPKNIIDGIVRALGVGG